LSGQNSVRFVIKQFLIVKKVMALAFITPSVTDTSVTALVSSQTIALILKDHLP